MAVKPVKKKPSAVAQILGASWSYLKKFPTTFKTK
jgi:hypothetical protein